MSNIGQPCERKLWYELQGEGGEELRPEHYLKFIFGDLIEELILTLAVLAGHRVEGRQDEQVIEGIKGHRDAVIDGVTVDVKSASTPSYKKFREGLTPEGDSFGYLDQLDSYMHAGLNDPIVTDKDRGAFLVLDKTLGHLHLDVHKRRELPWEEIYKHKKNMVSKEEAPPRKFEALPEGKSGNKKLGTNCSYCPFKQTCWPGVRTFLYANKPVYLTEVVRLPNVPELRGKFAEEENQDM